MKIAVASAGATVGAGARAAVVASVLAMICGCGAAAKHDGTAGIPRAGAMLPDVRTAKDRPPVVLVSREGDPAGAVAVAVTVAPDVGAVGDDAEPAVALAGVVEARLAARGIRAAVTPQWDGYRAVMLTSSTKEADTAARAIRFALQTPIDDRDLAAAKKKLNALASRPLQDVALGRWARCAAAPFAVPARAGKSGSDLTLAKLESFRTASHGLGRVAVAVAGPPAMGDAAATAIADEPEWKAAGAAPASKQEPSAITFDTDVYDASTESGVTQAIVHATLDVGTSSAAVATAEALGDPHGPLATRLATLDVPFRLREITGTAHPLGGCVGFVLEATGNGTYGQPPVADLPARVADAVALVRLEADVRLAEGGSSLDGRTLARRAGDPREAAERAAWWSLVDTSDGPRTATSSRGSIALGLPSRRGATQPASLEPIRDALKGATQRAMASWQKLAVDGRTRVERGQGETWVLVASPCGTQGEADADAGVSALFVVAAAELAKTAPDVRVEPWIANDGAGLLVHGPALAGESPSMHARRLADLVAETFAATPLSETSIARARGELQRRDTATGGAPLAVLAGALAPQHPAWVVPTGMGETFARLSDASIAARAQALRAGPVRVAVLANVDEAQGEAALRATDRWVDRGAGEARTCRPSAAATAARPGTYAAAPRPGAAPEALLAFPLPADDARTRATAQLVAAALDGDGGLLEGAVAHGAGLARATSARVLGWPHAPALVVRVVSNQAALDGAVMQTRALFDRLHKGGLPAEALSRASGKIANAAVAEALDPRARVVATWRGEAIPSAPTPPSASPATTTLDGDVRSFAQKYLGEESLIIVAARPTRNGSP